MKKNMTLATVIGIALATGVAVTPAAYADDDDKGGKDNKSCAGLPSHAELHAALVASVAPSVSNGGLDFNMWATVVNRDGVVCAVAFTGGDRGEQWPGSRVISAQKANTANAFSLPGFALSSANLWTATQPGGSLFGLQFSNPVDTAVAYGKPSHSGDGGAKDYGTPKDPMTGNFIGGINVFGGGLGLYPGASSIIGGLGVSGDTSCADHNVAWRVREALGMDVVPGGVGGGKDRLLYDLDANGVSSSGFGHPECGFNEVAVGVAIDSAIDTP